MWGEWGKYIKRQCAMIGRGYLKWEIGGRLRGAQPPCVFDGLVNGFAVFPVLFCCGIAANIAAVLAVV